MVQIRPKQCTARHRTYGNRICSCRSRGGLHAHDQTKYQAYDFVGPEIGLERCLCVPFQKRAVGRDDQTDRHATLRDGDFRFVDLSLPLLTYS